MTGRAGCTVAFWPVCQPDGRRDKGCHASSGPREHHRQTSLYPYVPPLNHQVKCVEKLGGVAYRRPRCASGSVQFRAPSTVRSAFHDLTVAPDVPGSPMPLRSPSREPSLTRPMARAMRMMPDANANSCVPVARGRVVNRRRPATGTCTAVCLSVASVGGRDVYDRLSGVRR